MSGIVGKRVALYGGAFDPPHNGHLMVMSLLLNSNVFETVLVAPSPQRPDKPAQTPFATRLGMVSECVKSCGWADRVVVTDLHSHSGYGTIDLWSTCRVAYPASEFRFVIGSELLGELPNWKEAGRVRDEVKFAVIARQGIRDPGRTAGYDLVEVPNPHGIGMTLSSTALRELFRAGKDVRGLTPPAVVDIVQKEQLYGVSS